MRDNLVHVCDQLSWLLKHTLPFSALQPHLHLVESSNSLFPLALAETCEQITEMLQTSTSWLRIPKIYDSNISTGEESDEDKQRRPPLPWQSQYQENQNGSSWQVFCKRTRKKVKQLDWQQRSLELLTYMPNRNLKEMQHLPAVPRVLEETPRLQSIISCLLCAQANGCQAQVPSYIGACANIVKIFNWSWRSSINYSLGCLKMNIHVVW